MDTAQWPEDVLVKQTEEIVTNKCQKPSLERKRPQKDEVLNCPRCESTNTKFCYYNNYSLSQPRYFCKTCRRYWTEGGSLRNIPVGGSSRKNKRSSKKMSDGDPARISQQSQNPNNRDLNLGFSIPPSPSGCVNKDNNIPSLTWSKLSALELLRGFSSGGLSSFLPMSITDPDTVYPSGFPLNFSSAGFGSTNESFQGGEGEETSGKLVFPFEDLKGKTTDDDVEQNGNSTEYWNGVIGGGPGGSW